MIEVRPAQRRDAELIAPYLRARELALMGDDPVTAIRDQLRLSLVSYTVFKDDRIALIWGVRGVMLDQKAYLWMAGTPLIEEHPLLFLRYSQRAIRFMSRQFGQLYGEVECDYDASKRWLTWLGAELYPNDKSVIFSI